MNASSYGGDLIDIFAGGAIDSGTANWLQQREEQLRSTISTTAAAFFDRAHSMYSMISNSDAMQILRNLKAKMTQTWGGNDITYLDDLAKVQTAGPVMQRWILAHPELRGRYLNQEIDGYEGSYVNYHGDAVGAQHYDWRRVMDGIVQADDDGFRYTHYLENIPEGERELSLFEKVDILKTWNIVSEILDQGVDDPTSPCGNPL